MQMKNISPKWIAGLAAALIFGVALQLRTAFTARRIKATLLNSKCCSLKKG